MNSLKEWMTRKASPQELFEILEIADRLEMGIIRQAVEREIEIRKRDRLRRIHLRNTLQREQNAVFKAFEIVYANRYSSSVGL